MMRRRECIRTRAGSAHQRRSPCPWREHRSASPHLPAQVCASALKLNRAGVQSQIYALGIGEAPNLTGEVCAAAPRFRLQGQRYPLQVAGQRYPLQGQRYLNLSADAHTSRTPGWTQSLNHTPLQPRTRPARSVHERARSSAQVVGPEVASTGWRGTSARAIFKPSFTITNTTIFERCMHICTGLERHRRGQRDRRSI